MIDYEAPPAMMFLTSECPHCGTLLHELCDMVKAGELASLKVVNLALQPDEASKHGVRSVPWLQIGDIVLTGLRARSELREWAAKAYSIDAMIMYLNELLTTGNLEAARLLVQRQPDYLQAVMEILANPEAKINVRVGVGVLIEDLEGTAELQKYLPDLVSLTQHASVTVRSDAAHYLSLTRDSKAIPTLRYLMNDEHPDVREIAEDGLALFES